LIILAGGGQRTVAAYRGPLIDPQSACLPAVACRHGAGKMEKVPSRAGPVRSNVSSHAASEEQKETVYAGDTRDTTEAKHTAAGSRVRGEFRKGEV